MTPARIVSLTVGLILTTSYILVVHRIEPLVSVPSDTTTRVATTDIADPLLDPQVSSNIV